MTSVERRYRAGVRPEAFADDRVAELADRLETAGFSFRLFEITSDIGVPTFSCFLAPCGVETARQARYVDVSHGCGAHPDPVRAVVRAMVFVGSVLYILGLILTDISYTLVDPRIRFA